MEESDDDAAAVEENEDLKGGEPKKANGKRTGKGERKRDQTEGDEDAESPSAKEPREKKKKIVKKAGRTGKAQAA